MTHGPFAGKAVRRNMVEEIGRFDAMLGPGSRFPSCDDRDIAMRALLARYHVYETSTIAINILAFGLGSKAANSHTETFSPLAPPIQSSSSAAVSNGCLSPHMNLLYTRYGR